ncbi:CKLF-like MARVEL transmembrane domain-containing protein 8 [Paramacrobiotus metropolitanus]|uniref:CKLF-like MARVEL transmembrane domain-containing protein 8 n=1 Tax=Paramacrobiotus metropolitanus TaxID=2943436 RepID=UPI002445F85C|nr:CKLF-like MARVEL transmembrane domain-containing protein 8 [Paramacrobiotus metropolitanus]
MDIKPARSSAVPPPARSNPSVVQSTRKMMGVDSRYCISIPGCLKIAEIVVGVICGAVCQRAYFAGNQFFLFVVILCIIISTTLLFLHFAKVPKIFTLPGGVQWPFVEFVYASGAALLYAIAASVQVARTVIGDNKENSDKSSTYDRYLAAGIIAFLNVGLYSADAFIHYQQYRNNQVQGPV